MSAATGNPTTTLDERTFKGKAADGEEVTVNIDSVYAQYLAEPVRLEAVVDRYARVMSGISGGGATADQLVVIVRPTNYLANSLPAGTSIDHFVPPRPLAGDLSYFLAVDSTDTIRTAGREDLAHWHLSEADAWTRARQQLKTRVGPLQLVRLGGEDGPSGLGAESGLAPSIIADPALCGPGAPEGRRGWIVLIFDRETLLFADPSDEVQTQRFWAVIKQARAARTSLSSTPLTCRNGHWVVARAP